MNRKECKSQAKKRFGKNYGRCFLVCFLVALLSGGTLISTIQKKLDVNSVVPFQLQNKTNSDIVNDFLRGMNHEDYILKHSNGFLGTLFNSVSKSGSFLFGVLNAMNQFLFHEQIIPGVIILIGMVLSLFYWIFISNLFQVGKCRFFLENRLYSKTRINRVLLPYRVRKNVNVCLVMLRKNIYLFLWCFTILGGPVKYYSYRMVPWLLAENPSLSSKEAIRLSKEMMCGHKMELFFLDLSFIGYYILGFLSFNLINLFFTIPYHEASLAEFYIYIRELYAKKNPAVIYDVSLDENKDALTHYPEEKYPLKAQENRNLFRSLDYNRDYTINSYILLFLFASMIGWIWEVLLHLFTFGTFVNRGTLYGPWLPIYGTGGVLILLLLQKYRKKPWLTFLLTVLISGVLEYGTAFYLEMVHHLKWWDYTGFFLNLHGRICLEGLLLFGVGGIAFIYIFAPLCDQIMSRWKPSFRKWLCVVLTLCFVFDFIYSSFHPHTGNLIAIDVNEINS